MWILFVYLCLLTFVNSTSTGIKMSRKLTKAGFHRDIETILQIPVNFGEECDHALMLIFETLPSGVYVDPFEMKSLEHFGGLQVIICYFFGGELIFEGENLLQDLWKNVTDTLLRSAVSVELIVNAVAVHFGQTVDIEAAEFVSKSLELFVFLNVTSFSHSLSQDFLETMVILPIHTRYHLASSHNSHAEVRILHPGIYTNCRLKDQSDPHYLSAPCNVHNTDVCMWSQLQYESVSPHLTVMVPVGMATHKPLVITGTLLISLIVSAVLAKVIISYKHVHCDKVS